MPLVKTQRDFVLQKTEVDMMIHNCNNNIMYKGLIAIWYITGFRVSEIIDLKKEIELKIYTDDHDERILELIHKPLKKRNKSGITSSHKIYLNIKDIPYANHIYDIYNAVDNGQKLFPISRVRVWQIIKKLNPNAWCHLARHTRATNLVEDGYDIHILMQFLGWSSTSVAIKYIKNKPLRNIIIK